MQAHFTDVNNICLFLDCKQKIYKVYSWTHKILVIPTVLIMILSKGGHKWQLISRVIKYSTEN